MLVLRSNNTLRSVAKRDREEYIMHAFKPFFVAAAALAVAAIVAALAGPAES